MSLALGVRTVRQNFFDKARVLSKVERAHARVQAAFGAFARRRAKSLVRYRKASSPPGQPPSAHRSDRFTREKNGRRQSQSPLRELIFFARDPAANSVVVGPAIFQSRSGTGGQVPGALERGGKTTTRVREPAAKKTGRKATRRQAQALRKLLREGRLVLPRRAVRLVSASVAPHPYMGPSGEETTRSEKFRRLLKGMVR